ncbi:family 43 glycosylhydrolase [Paenibacillus sp. CAU 1782]
MKKIASITLAAALSLSLLAGAGGSPEVQAASEPPLKLWYKFDETEGSKAVDSSGNGFDGTYVNAVVREKGVDGTSYAMTGGASNSATAPYIAIPNGVLNGLDQMTVAAWVKWSGGSANQWLYALGADSNRNQFLSPRLWSGKLHSAIKNGGGEQVADGAEAMDTGVWKHVAVTIDPAARTSVLYLDGVALSRNTNTTIKPSDLYDAAKGYSGYIGKSFYADPYFSGQVDDFRIYSAALSEEDINVLYNASLDASQVVAEAKANLSIGKTIVTDDIQLPGQFNGTEIAWQSGKPAYLSHDGKVTRPAAGEQPVVAALTATLSKGEVSDTRPFTITILPEGYDIQFTSYNPIFKSDDKGNQIFTADPAALVDGDTLYVYAGRDQASLGGWFSINEWVCFSTKDMVNWTYEGPVMKSTDFSWATSGTAWASQVIERGGKYYLYSTSGRQNNQGYTIGVAVSDSPVGPFVDALGQPLLDNAITTGGTLSSMEDIDPTVFIDDDGQAYLYWGNGKLHYALLNEDMISFKDLNGDGRITEGADIFTNVPINGLTGGIFSEAPWLYKKNGKYYLVFAQALPQKVAYATSDSPVGPWQYQGVILGPNLEPNGGSGTISSDTSHPAVVEFKGQSYLFYHNAALPTGGQTRRSVSVEAIYYNEDGGIQPAQITSTGPFGTASLIQSNRYPDQFITFSGYDTALGRKQGDELPLKWEVLPGLADEATLDTVSLQVVNKPGYYLSANGSSIVLAKHDHTTGFKNRATFRKVPGLADSEWVSFQSISNPELYIRQSDGNGSKLRLDAYSAGSSGSDKQDATFRIIKEAKSGLPTAALSGASLVQPGSTFTLGISLENMTQSVYAQDIALSYDAGLFQYVSAAGADDRIQLVTEDKSQSGKIRLIAANIGGVSGESTPVLNVVFKVNGGVQSTSGIIATTHAKLGTAPQGTVIQAALASKTIAVGSTDPGVDKGALQAAITAAQDLYDGAVVGTLPGQYPKAATDELGAAIDAATAVLDLASATQLQVDGAVVALNSAVDDFKASVIQEASADLNGDGVVNVGDLAMAAYHYGKDSASPDWQTARVADMNRDDKIDIADLSHIASAMAE